jgi:hypothetical protein
VSRRETPLDARRIFEALANARVEYVLIGGLAVQAHGHTRTTQDVDLVPADDSANLARLSSALEAVGARPAGSADSAPEKPLILAAAGIASLDTDAGGVDVHFSPPGAGAFAELRRRALVIELGEIEVAVASRDDLIAMKRAAGQPIDRGDVIALTEPHPG